MGLITTAIRNRLLADKATKLIYIHMNQRVIDDNTTFRNWQEGTEEERVELEKLITQMEEEGAGDDPFDEEIDNNSNEINDDKDDEIELEY
jgi:hypothetical protein